MNQELLDELARLENEQWRSWALRLLDTETLSEERVNRWLGYIKQEWSSMSEEDKAKDREWAQRAIAIFEKHKG